MCLRVKKDIERCFYILFSDLINLSLCIIILVTNLVCNCQIGTIALRMKC